MSQATDRSNKPKCRVIQARDLKLGDIFFLDDELVLAIVCTRPDYHGYSNCKVMDMMGEPCTARIHVDDNLVIVTDERVIPRPEA